MAFELFECFKGHLQPSNAFAFPGLQATLDRKNEHALYSLLICEGFSLTGTAMNAYPLRDLTCLWLAYYSCLS